MLSLRLDVFVMIFQNVNVIKVVS